MHTAIEYLNPDDLHENPAYSQVVVISGAVRNVHIGGQNAVDASGALVGVGEIGTQARQIFKNLEIALQAAGAKVEHIVKWNVYVVQGADPGPAFETFRSWWGDRPHPPLITFLFVAGLAHPDFLMEIDALAAVPAG
ncbi:MAG: RidA family protein [Spirochaetales bacterium]|nr:RidA family protein [Spirochaetales bacterium]